MWVSLIIALVSFFLSKKSGASTGQSAAIAAASGLGTYYVATETDWGKRTLGSVDAKIDGWINPTTKETIASSDVQPLTENGQPVLDADGAQVYEQKSKPAVKNSDGSWFGALVSSAGGVLKSWGGVGTAAVIGAGSVASGSSLQKWMPWLLGGLGVYLLVRK